VSFAGRYGDEVTIEAAALRPSLVVHDSFAVIGQVVAHHLGVPRVNVCAGHNMASPPTLDALNRDPRVPVDEGCLAGIRVRIDERCLAAVRVLRERHGMPDASPFSHASGVSPDLNVYCEPPQFLRPEERGPFEPIAFFGSLGPEATACTPSRGQVFGGASGARLRVYASFGTVIWRYYEDAAVSALEALSCALAEREDAEALVSLGGAGPMDRASRLASRNVRIEHYVDQWEVLRHASVYLTHQGLNSTHEAIAHGVPMISYPFFWDQPALAVRCQELGLAVPLVGALRGGIAAGDIHAALEHVEASRPRIESSLATAREWEFETIRARPAVIDRILRLVR
jgi:UDP:flavonoid glycosyltransferase YjiC (YdhE family)